MQGLVVMSIPKSGTNFLTRFLAETSGWNFRWGRPTRQVSSVAEELPLQPDPYIFERAEQLIFSDLDMARRKRSDQPSVFGGRKVNAVEYTKAELEILEAASRRKAQNVIVAEHPVRSLPFLLRNPQQVPLITPAEVLRDAKDYEYGVVFLHRDIRDIANSFAHFLFAGTRFVKFKTLNESFEAVVHRYLPPLASAIRLWETEFDGLKVRYEDLHQNTNATLTRIVERFELPIRQDQIVNSMSDFKAFTFRKGGTRDFRGNLSDEHLKLIESEYPDLITGELNRRAA